jgi:hypothetical protein
MASSVSGKIAFVTGGASGIGVAAYRREPPEGQGFEELMHFPYIGLCFRPGCGGRGHVAYRVGQELCLAATSSRCRTGSGLVFDFPA